MSELDQLQRRLADWTFEQALPLWRTAGTDSASGGFQEVLDHDRRQTPRARRARVQTRQTYVFCWAGGRGWSGDWKGAAIGGFDHFVGRYTLPDGQVRTLVSPEGGAMSDDAALYDQAFALFAYAAVAAAVPERREAAVAAADRLREALESRRNPAGGFVEIGQHPYQSNAHMHLFEAALAWEDASDDPAWPRFADAIAALALDRFIDRDLGFVREHFKADWSPAAGPEGQLLEPGHQFEWGWLLNRWARKRGDARAAAAAARLYRIGADHGVDARGVTINVLRSDMTPVDRMARLWPQTERLRAAASIGDEAGAAEAARVLLRYFETPVPGLWRDKLAPDDGFVDEPAPASSLYHIVGGVGALLDL